MNVSYCAIAESDRPAASNARASSSGKHGAHSVAGRFVVRRVAPAKLGERPIEMVLGQRALA